MSKLSDTTELLPVRWAQSARRHRVGCAHARFVMETAVPNVVPATEDRDARFVWVGFDDRNLELEVGALHLSDCLMIVHVMPTDLRRR